MVALRGLLRYVRDLRAGGGGQELGGVHHWLGLGLCESDRCILLKRGLHQVCCAVEARFGLPKAATAALHLELSLNDSAVMIFLVVATHTSYT